MDNTIAAGGATAPASTQEKKAAFEQGLLHILQSWTCLSLAVEQSWGGRTSSQKREELYTQLLTCFYAGSSDFIALGRRRVSCGSVVASDENLADFLTSQLEIKFHIQTEEDDEFLEVAQLMRQLADSLKRSDFTVYQRVMAMRSDGHMRSVAQGGIDNSLYDNAQPAGPQDDSSDSENGYAREEDVIEEAEGSQTQSMTF